MFISAIEAPSGSRLPSSFSAAKVVSKSLAITRIFNLHKIKADNIKILFSGHGNEGLKTTGRKTANDIANIVATLRGVLPVQSSIDTVAMKGCNPGADFSRDVAMELKARNIETKVSSRLGSSRNSLLWLDHFLTEQQHNVCP
jgi:hypothetical protein